MTTPLRTNINVWRGDTLRQSFTINNAGNTAAEDLTGWTIRIRGEHTNTHAEVFDQAPTPASPATGTFELYLTPTETLALPAGQLVYYQVQTTDPSGDLITQFDGYLIAVGNLPA